MGGAIGELWGPQGTLEALPFKGWTMHTGRSPNCRGPSHSSLSVLSPQGSNWDPNSLEDFVSREATGVGEWLHKTVAISPKSPFLSLQKPGHHLNASIQGASCRSAPGSQLPASDFWLLVPSFQFLDSSSQLLVFWLRVSSFQSGSTGCFLLYRLTFLHGSDHATRPYTMHTTFFHSIKPPRALLLQVLQNCRKHRLY